MSSLIPPIKTNEVRHSPGILKRLHDKVKTTVKSQLEKNLKEILRENGLKSLIGSNLPYFERQRYVM